MALTTGPWRGMMICMDDLLTARQLQELLQVDRVTIYRMLEDGRLRGFKVGGQWRFYRRDIDTWLRRQYGTIPIPESHNGAKTIPADSASAFPIACIQAVQGIFAEACGTTVVTVSLDATPITEVSTPGEFCRLVMTTPQGRGRCMASWRSAVADRSNPAGTHTCHAGLQYVAKAIKTDGRVVALLLAGQLNAASAAGSGALNDSAELARECAVDAAALQQAAQQIAVHTAKEVEHIIRLAERTAETIAEIAYERTRLLKRLKQIAEMTVLD